MPLKTIHSLPESGLETSFKQALTRLGSRLSNRSIERTQAMVNYLRMGRWMRNHGFTFEHLTGMREGIWDAVTKRICERKVLYLEFGVAEGSSMSYWSQALKHPESYLHGFDSFEGLPESGGPWAKGAFSTGGAIPKFEDPRIRLFKGWFEQVLPTYTLPPHEVLVLNMDADLYSSTIYVLRRLRPHIHPGTFVYFDDFFCPEHEPLAFQEFLNESGLKFKGVAAQRTLARVFFECASG
jgi:hypothetical protein